MLLVSTSTAIDGVELDSTLLFSKSIVSTFVMAVQRQRETIIQQSSKHQSNLTKTKTNINLNHLEIKFKSLKQKQKQIQHYNLAIQQAAIQQLNSTKTAIRQSNSTKTASSNPAIKIAIRTC